VADPPPSTAADAVSATEEPMDDTTDVTPEADPAPAAAPAAALRLEAISQRDGQPVAVVNGQLVRVGDQIGAATIVRIGVAEIEIETDGLRRVLRF
jgi:hypothetical protein